MIFEVDGEWDRAKDWAIPEQKHVQGSCQIPVWPKSYTLKSNSNVKFGDTFENIIVKRVEIYFIKLISTSVFFRHWEKVKFNVCK